MVLTRVSGRASAMPERETLANFAATGATLAIHLVVHALERVVTELLAPLRCATALSPSSTGPHGRTSASSHGTLATIAGLAAQEPMERTALILVGPVLGTSDFRESALYDPGYRRRYRGAGTEDHG